VSVACKNITCVGGFVVTENTVYVSLCYLYYVGFSNKPGSDILKAVIKAVGGGEAL
jgi:hypothetical protein